MTNILLVTSSPRGADSLSSKIAAELALKLKAQAGDNRLVHRDLAADPVPHLDAVSTAAIRKAADDRTPAEAAAADYSDGLVCEVLAADTLIIATGMINFGIYSTLKSWIDNVARAGQTFTYTDSGPVGLAAGKKVFLVIASGGVYSQGPAAVMDHAVPYLKTVFGFLGMSDVEVIHVEGVAFGPQAAEEAIASAQARISALAA